MYETRGSSCSSAISATCVGVFTTDIGALSTYTRMWGVRRATPSASSAARACRPTSAGRRSSRSLQPLMHTQQNRILIPTSFSPIR